MVFSPWSRTITPFPLLCSKIQAFQSESRQETAWDNNNAMPYFSTPPKPKYNPRKHAPGKTTTRWSNRRHRFNPIKTDRFNTCDSDSSDLNKLDIIQPTPKRICNRSPKGCTYCAYNAPHPSPAPSDWSSEDWDWDKAKAKEQRLLINFKLLDTQAQNTIQETMIDRQEKDLVNGIDNLMLDADKTAPVDTLAPKLDMTDILAPQPDMTEKECKVEGTKDKKLTPMYNMTEQEQSLQCEEKFNIYMSTFGYEGDDSDLDSDMDSNVMAYPYVE